MAMSLGGRPQIQGLARRLSWPRDARGLLNLIGIGKTLSSERIAAEEAPPAFLQIQPACPGRNEDVVDARMLVQPGACLATVMTAEVVRDDDDVPFGLSASMSASRQYSSWSCVRRHSGSAPCRPAHVRLHRPRFSQDPGCNPMAL